MRAVLFLLAGLAINITAWTTIPLKLQKSATVSSTQCLMLHRRAALNDLATAGAVAFGAALTCVTGAVSNANAADFVGSYSDPKHPNCVRLVAVEGTEAILTGADGNPGCPTGEGKPWRLTGRVSGDNIFVDFSPKGGPKDLTGVWEAGKNPGIRWPDGNKWSLMDKPDF